MTFSLYSIFTVVVLILNALAILSENRLLSKLGLSTHAQYNRGSQQSYGSGDENDGFGSSPFVSEDLRSGSGDGGSPIKMQIATLLSSVRTLMRWPLIFVNTVLIALALIFG